MNPPNIRSVNRARLIFHFVTKVFPLVKQELNLWQSRAAKIPDARLSLQALESIRAKAFHCQGGSIYALYPGVNREETIRFIVAYQTMSDYLDNLVDSLEVQDEKAFAQLHLAMHEALNPQTIPSDYYQYYPYQDDGGYLAQLVETCQESVGMLPAYDIVRDEAINLAKLYANLQTYKHLPTEEREMKMLDWINPYLKEYPDITAWEFAAATGSTLGIFCLYAAAFNPQLTAEQSRGIRKVYFPWICGLHILLDYFIDLREDQETDQLNFVAYYKDIAILKERLLSFLENSLMQTKSLNFPQFHRAVVQGLLAMYLSDGKSMDQAIRSVTKQLLLESGMVVNILHWMCCQLRVRKVL